MKITAIETVQLPHLNNILWVQVHTDEGIVGLGETFRGANAVAAYIHSDVAPLLLARTRWRSTAFQNCCWNPMSAFAPRAWKSAPHRQSTSRFGIFSAS